MDNATHDPQLLKGVLGMLVLQVLCDEETYGYELVTRLTSRGLSGISTGTVYPVLNRLEREGLLASRLMASTAGPARKYYCVTPQGVNALVDAIGGWEDLAAAVRSVLGSGRRPITASAGSDSVDATTAKGKTS